MAKIVANWKMYGDLALTQAFLGTFSPTTKHDIIWCPPSPLLGWLSNKTLPLRWNLGSQDCSTHEASACTGDVSASLLKILGCQYVIVGHSERRLQHGETQADILKKIEHTQAAQMIPILCIGETLEMHKLGETKRALETMLSNLPAFPLWIAYEPVWAIGGESPPKYEEIANIHSFLRDLFGPHQTLLYGGAVSPRNAQDLLSIPNVDGLLVGRASLDIKMFENIVYS